MWGVGLVGGGGELQKEQFVQGSKAGWWVWSVQRKQGIELA